MSEHEDLFAVYGAIDTAVKNNPELAATVGRFLPGYASGGAVGWFDEFTGFMRQHAPDAAVPTAHEALTRLADTPARGRMAARRIHALSVAARVADHLDVPDAATHIQNAHHVEGVRGTADHATPENVIGLVTNDDVFSHISDWTQLVNHGVATRLLDPSLAVHASARPCSGELVDVHTAGDEFPAAELRTSFETDAVTAPQAERFLEPSNWPAASEFWCLMEQVGTTPRGTRTYHEIVSLNCASRADNSTWTAEAFLDFAFVRTSNGARVSYQLDPDHENPQIDVDEGALSVQQVGNTVRVDTVKRIRFKHPFNGASLAMIMCALGYGNIAEKLVLDCAVSHAGSVTAGSRFPGTNPPRRVQHPRNQASKRSSRTPAAARTSRASRTARAANTAAPQQPVRPAGDVMRDMIDEMKQVLDEYADSYDTMYTKLQSRSLKPDDVMESYSQMLSRSVRRSATLVGHGVHMAKSVRAGYSKPAAADGDRHTDGGASAETGADTSPAEG